MQVHTYRSGCLLHTPPGRGSGICPVPLGHRCPRSGMAGSHKALNGTREGKDRESAGSLPLPTLCQREHRHYWKRAQASVLLTAEFGLMQGHVQPHSPPRQFHLGMALQQAVAKRANQTVTPLHFLWSNANEVPFV